MGKLILEIPLKEDGSVPEGYLTSKFARRVQEAAGLQPAPEGTMSGPYVRGTPVKLGGKHGSRLLASLPAGIGVSTVGTCAEDTGTNGDIIKVHIEDGVALKSLRGALVV
ncbi:MAG: hypothetical protein K9G62_02250 [Alphaproteobacteria bacterium]|nr:hypothetical protein [Alphaproteobacteria bacterium]